MLSPFFCGLIAIPITLTNITIMWSLIITFFVVIAVIDVLVKGVKKAAKPTRRNTAKRKARPQRTATAKSSDHQALKKAFTPNAHTNAPAPTPHRKEVAIHWTTTFLRALEWKRYEEICMEYLRIKNCMAEVTCIGADGGIDIRIKNPEGKVFAVAQCKAWSRPIGVNLIRELYGVMAAEKVKHGIFLTTSEYTPAALAFAKGKNLLLIDSDELIALINGLDDTNKKRLGDIATQGDYTTPTCVRCNTKMVRRTAKTGKNAGGEFWGCVNFPKCRIVMNIKQQ